MDRIGPNGNIAGVGIFWLVTHSAKDLPRKDWCHPSACRWLLNNMSGVEVIACLENEEEDSTKRNVVNDTYKETMTFGAFHSLYSGLLEEKPFFQYFRKT